MYQTKHYISFTPSEFLNNIYDFLNLIEWELIDNISDTNKVYKSSGEIPKDHNIYVNIYSGGQIIYCKVYTAYNTATHVGYNLIRNSVLLNRDFTKYTDIENRMNVFFVGSKDYMFYNYSNYKLNSLSFNNNGGFGFIPNIIYSLKKTCSSPISSGTNVVLQLDNTDGLKINNFYQLFDITCKAGCELVKISNIDAINKTVTLYSLTTSFPDGAYLGINVYNQFILDGTNFIDLWDLYKIGSQQNQYTFVQSDILYGSNTQGYPSITIKDMIDGRYFLNSPIYRKTESVYPVGYFGEEIKSWRASITRNIGKTILVYNEDNSDVKKDYSFPTFVDPNYSFITDIRKNWVVNSLVGKYVAFIGGAGAWQTRQILSNTSNSITFLNPIQEHINKTSQYIIVDKVYRTLTPANEPNLVALDIF